MVDTPRQPPRHPSEADPPTDQSGIDPYLFWLLGIGRPYYFSPDGEEDEGRQWIPLLLRLKGYSAQDFAAGLHITASEKRVAWQSAVRVPSLYTDSPIPQGDDPFITASINVGYLEKDFLEDEELRADLRRAIESVTPSLPLDRDALFGETPPPPEGGGGLKGTDGSSPPPPAAAMQAAPARRSPSPDGPRTATGRRLTDDDPPDDDPAPPPIVVMGIIDDGIAFANERFRRIVGGIAESRVENWWLQDGPFNPGHFPFTAPGGPPLPDVPYGCELSRLQINQLLAVCTNAAGEIDDDLAYHQARLFDFRQRGHKSAAWRTAHGTHVMDLACGFDPAPPRYDRPIICVQLPVRVTANTSGATLFRYVYDALWYIFIRASQIPGAANAPIVINLSYGRLAGPHDGTDLIELAIQAVVAASGGRVRVVLPAGNSYLLRTHAQVTFAADGERQELPWRAHPDDRTPNFVEVWLPQRNFLNFASRLTLTITSPIGETHAIGEFGPTVRWGGAAPFYAEARFYFSLLTGRTMFRLSTIPTTTIVPGAPLAPAGTWSIRLDNVALTGQTVHAWVQRDDSLYGFPLRGRQSYFNDPAYVRFDNAGRDNEIDDPGIRIRRESTLNSIATGPSGIFPATGPFLLVAGGLLRREVLPAKYSAAGASLASGGPPPRGPNAVVASEDSRVLHGVLAAGSHSGSVVLLGGTSVAAPQMARFIADDIAGLGPGTAASVALAAVPIPVPRPPFLSPPFWAERVGGGRLPTVPLGSVNR
jgi:hypothetical protein